MEYAKISGTFLNFRSGQRLETGTNYASREWKLEEKYILSRTYMNNKVIVTHFMLEGPELLNFTTQSDDPAIPVMTGVFLNSEYKEGILSCTLPDKNIQISGTITMLDQQHGLSIKTLLDAASGKLIAIMQERIEIISESEFAAATKAT